MQAVNANRIRIISAGGKLKEFAQLKSKNERRGPVVYWMSRDQRAEDNWALLFAREVAEQRNVPVSVVFNLVPKFLEATERQYDFMLQGLKETEEVLRSKMIPFYLLLGSPEETIPQFVSTHNVSALITDFSPLRVPRKWVADVSNKLENKFEMFTVDAHNVVPVWVTSEKQEYAARTIRPKIHKKTEEFLVEFPELTENSKTLQSDLPEPTNWEKANKSLQIDRTVKPVDWVQPGTKKAKQEIEIFCNEKLSEYAKLRNKPSENVLSNMSPYFHFGQIAPQRAILEVQKFGDSNPKCKESAACFVEEALVRRELSDNYCFYQENYDNIKGASVWAQETLQAHKDDTRDSVYSLEEFDQARTHSAFWNAMQTQLVVEGKLHGFCRMMWCKNILEWSESPSEALRIAIYLNDRYNLDGRDPNGFVGCMWSICGLHDQGWRERSVFGKIRYMNEAGCRRKFDVNAYITKYSKNTQTKLNFKRSAPARKSKPNKKQKI